MPFDDILQGTALQDTFRLTDFPFLFLLAILLSSDPPSFLHWLGFWLLQHVAQHPDLPSPLFNRY